MVLLIDLKIIAATPRNYYLRYNVKILVEYLVEEHKRIRKYRPHIGISCWLTETPAVFRQRSSSC